MNVYTEEQWFDTFYPKEWSNWRECYNIKKYRENVEVTGCSWMNYKLTGFCLSENENGLMGVRNYSYSKPQYLDHFFVETTCEEIQPFYQSKANKHYSGIAISKLTSNLDIYQVYVYGCDDASFTRHFLSSEELENEVKVIKECGIEHVFHKDSQYFFTN